MLDIPRVQWLNQCVVLYTSSLLLLFKELLSIHNEVKGAEVAYCFAIFKFFNKKAKVR